MALITKNPVLSEVDQIKARIVQSLKNHFVQSVATHKEITKLLAGTLSTTPQNILDAFGPDVPELTNDLLAVATVANALVPGAVTASVKSAGAASLNVALTKGQIK